MSAFGAGRDGDVPVLAAERHLSEALARHPVLAPADLNRRRLFNGTSALIGQLRNSQAQLVEDGQSEAATLYQEAIEALERARRRQARG